MSDEKEEKGTTIVGKQAKGVVIVDKNNPDPPRPTLTEIEKETGGNC